jgi:acyl-CoA hydrolase
MAGLLRSSELDLTGIVVEGDFVAWPQGTGEPTGLTARLMEQAPSLRGVTLVLGMVTTDTLDRSQNVDFLCLNGAANTRRATARSGNRVIPAHLSSIPDLILSRRIRVDVALVRVRPTSDPDTFSLGVMVDFVHEMIDAARVVIAEIDERMPRTSGDVFVSRDRITHFVIADGDEPMIADAGPSETDFAVARRVAELIPDRATVQFGVGGMPVAVCRALSAHKDLGLHSGVIPDAAVDLIEAGVITNRHKRADEGVSVTGGLFGTRRLFDFANDNPEIQLRRASYTHAGSTMARIQALHSVNSAIAVDLSGQVNAETAGGRYLGAVGGQVDFVRGGRLSPGGRSIIAMASTTPDGRQSKIVADLLSQPVTTARSDVDLVVTEYGVAELWGLDLPARAKALISVAHPQFREELARQLEMA